MRTGIEGEHVTSLGSRPRDQPVKQLPPVAEGAASGVGYQVIDVQGAARREHVLDAKAADGAHRSGIVFQEGEGETLRLHGADARDEAGGALPRTSADRKGRVSRSSTVPRRLLPTIAALDADGNQILGAGAVTPAVSSAGSGVTIATPAPSASPIGNITDTNQTTQTVALSATPAPNSDGRPETSTAQLAPLARASTRIRVAGASPGPLAALSNEVPSGSTSARTR